MIETICVRLGFEAISAI